MRLNSYFQFVVVNDQKTASSIRYKLYFETKLIEKIVGKHHFKHCKIISALVSLENKKRLRRIHL